MTMKSGYNQMLQTWSISEFYNFYSKKVDHYKCIVGMHMCVFVCIQCPTTHMKWTLNS